MLARILVPCAGGRRWKKMMCSLSLQKPRKMANQPASAIIGIPAMNVYLQRRRRGEWGGRAVGGGGAVGGKGGVAMWRKGARAMW